MRAAGRARSDSFMHLLDGVALVRVTELSQAAFQKNRAQSE
jgi:hypothetical protein